MTDFTLDRPFTNIEIQMAAQCMAALIGTVALDASIAEMRLMQPARAEFWQAASEHLRRDQPLHTFLSQHWPPMYATPVEIGEHAGELSKVFSSIATTAELQISIHATLRRLIYPAAMICAGAGISLFFMLYVIPVLSAVNSDGSHVSAAMRASIAMHDFVTKHRLVVSAMAVGAVMWLVSIARNPETTARALVVLDHIPLLAESVRSLYYGLWARYIALMLECGISLQDSLPISYPLLLSYMVPALEAVRDNAKLGYANAVDTTRLSQSDPRCGLPIFVRNAFRLTDQTGSGEKHFHNAAEPLVKLGLLRINRFISLAEKVATAVAGLFVMTPVGLYFSQMVDLLNNINR